MDKLILSYGHDPESGYYYEIWEAMGPNDPNPRIIESKKSQENDLTKEVLYKLLDDWNAPREHLLAVSLGMQF